MNEYYGFQYIDHLDFHRSCPTPSLKYSLPLSERISLNGCLPTLPVSVCHTILSVLSLIARSPYDSTSRKKGGLPLVDRLPVCHLLSPSSLKTYKLASLSIIA